LFPFFVISELLIGFGIVHFIGTLFDPMMRPLFRVPGIGGFIMAMGFASGYPVGARLTSQLWEQKLVTRDEGERLVAFTTSSDPIFLIGAVSIGFFHDAGLAVILAVSHYGSSILVGLIMRFHGAKETIAAIPSDLSSSKSIWIRSFQAMHHARLSDGRPFGLLLTNAVQSSLKLSFVVGGLVVFFAVIIEMFTQAHIMHSLYATVQWLLNLFHFPIRMSESVVNGFFEVTLGARSAGSAGDTVPLIYKVAIASFVLSWAGLSVHAQIVSLMQHTGMRYGPFLFARFIHAVLALLMVIFLWKPLTKLKQWLPADLPVFQPENSPLTTLQTGAILSASVFVGSLAIIIILFAIYRLSRVFYTKLIK
jgi:sporulation integral membrane protein YlbJ